MLFYVNSSYHSFLHETLYNYNCNYRQYRSIFLSVFD